MSLATRQREKHKDELVGCAARLLLAHPFASFTREALVQESGVKYTQVRSYFSDIDWLKRRAAERLFVPVRAALEAASRPNARSAHNAVRDYLGATAELIESSEYRALLRMIIREGPTEPWLRALYEEQVVDIYARELLRRIEEAGRNYDTHLSLKPGAAFASLRKLELALAVPSILPVLAGGLGAVVPSPVEGVVSDLIDATYAWGAIAA
jgi:AcrR family transcriptional regulator